MRDGSATGGWRIKEKEKRGLKIDSSMIGMESARTYRARATVRRQGIKDYQDNLGGMFGNALSGTMTREKISRASVHHNYEIGTNALQSSEEENVSEGLRQITIRYIFQLLFASGRHTRNHWMEARMQTGRDFGTVRKVNTRIDQDYNLSQASFAESENTGFTANGKVRTSDGREIDFQLELTMSRSFEMHFHQEVENAKKVLKDPLVINFDAPAAQITDQKFFFDLDADGREEEVSMLEAGSGFLALDVNEDGLINDGSELFGTKSGNGFADLAEYDQDMNGWIDENDEIWSKLKIWAKDVNGRDVLYRLADKNVGAIYLGNLDTDFSLLDTAGQTGALIRKTGLFLYENGLAGTVQHLDLATYQKQA